MKKLMLLIAACCLVFVSCNNKPVEEAEVVEATDSVAVEDETCQMTEEEIAFKADWENWANQTDERKAELLAKKKECFDKHIAEMQAKKAECEAKHAECEAKHAEMTKAYAGWEKMTLDEQKAFMDQYAPCCKGHKCGHDGCCKDGAKHECNGQCDGKCDGKCDSKCDSKCDGKCDNKCDNKCNHDGGCKNK